MSDIQKYRACAFIAGGVSLALELTIGQQLWIGVAAGFLITAWLLLVIDPK